MTYRWLRIDWSGHLTRAWPGYSTYIVDQAIKDIYGVAVRAAMTQPSPFVRFLAAPSDPVDG